MSLLAAEHVAAVALGAILALGATWAARRHPGPWVIVFSRALAVVILAAYAAENAALVARGIWTVERGLPFHLTDVVTVVAAIALWRPRPLAFELAYFWGLGASLQAVLTPDLGDPFPDLFFWAYFVTHVGVVVAAVFLAWGRGLVPRPGSVGRVFAATAAFATLAGIANLVTGANYMFLREKPDTSLLDLMGPWPWYVATAAILALVLFTLLDLPFRARRREAGAS